MTIYFVIPDYYEGRPKACMNGWGAIHLTIAPDGVAMPCQEARIIEGLEFPSVRDKSLAWLWNESPTFQKFRGDAWMSPTCRSCDEKEKDFGGCRCQAFLLTGDASNTDPACSRSPHHHLITEAIAKEEKLESTTEDLLSLEGMDRDLAARLADAGARLTVARLAVLFAGVGVALAGAAGVPPPRIGPVRGCCCACAPPVNSRQARAGNRCRVRGMVLMECFRSADRRC